MSKAAARFMNKPIHWLSLVGANLIVTIIALVWKWSLGDLLWTFYIQSLIIAWFSIQRMRVLKDFSTEGFTSNGNPVPESEEGKRSTIIFFILHFGGFHFIYLIFLFGMSMPNSLLHWISLLACGVSFWLAQKQTFEEQIATDAQGRPNLGSLMFLPYIRIIPIHLSIIFVSSIDSGIGILFFMLLKTVADLALDRLDRYLARRAITSNPARDNS